MYRRGHIPISLQGALLLGALGLCAAVPAPAVGSPEQTVHAHLASVAPTKHGTGTFTASGGSGQTVIVRWHLSLANLSGPAKRATLQTTGPKMIVFELCRPCSARAHGQLVVLGSVWSQIAARGGSVVVATKAHPRGELRGVLTRV